MDLPERSSSTSDTSVSAGRSVFWLGIGFCTVAAPWLLGGQPLLAQGLLLAGAVLGLVGGLQRHFSGPLSPGARSAWRIQKWILGAGLLFFLYLVAQALNPSLTVVFSSGTWTVLPVDQAFPGPHSVRTPFLAPSGDLFPYTNVWRFVLLFGTAWLFAAALALGLRRREDARLWVQLAAINGLAVAVVSIIHRALGEKLTLWYFHSTETHSGSPVFLYKNHNGSFLAAILAAMLGLAATAEDRSRRIFWEAAAALAWVATVAVNSRAATGLATLWVIIYAVTRWRAARKSPGPSSRPWLFLSLAAAGLIAVFVFINGSSLAGRFRPALADPVGFARGEPYRGLLRQVGMEMWKDDPAWGWGGGAFMYLFNNYEGRVPELRAAVYRSEPNLNHFVVASADSDWVEFLVEYGLAGTVLLVAAAAAAVFAWARWRGWRNPLALFLFLGAAGLVLHAYLDHILRNPALVLLLAALAVSLVRFAAPGRQDRAS